VEYPSASGKAFDRTMALTNVLNKAETIGVARAMREP
jgi:hypothetical protein